MFNTLFLITLPLFYSLNYYNNNELFYNAFLNVHRS
jgi:hypothetical protein